MGELLTFISDILTKSYFLATILNLIFTPFLMKGKFGKIQNRISLCFLLGITIFFMNLLTILLQEGLGFKDFFNALIPPDGKHYLYKLMWIYPYVLFPLHLIKRIRASVVLVILSLLFFYPILFEFFIILSSSDFNNLFDINSAYTLPIIKIILSGGVLYTVLFSLETINKEQSKSLDDYLSN